MCETEKLLQTVFNYQYVRVACRVDGVSDLLEVERKRFSSLIRVVEPCSIMKASPNKRAGARLARTGHQTRHTLVRLDVGCKCKENTIFVVVSEA